MGTGRAKIPQSVETDVLTRSRRRCCICYGLNRDLDVKQGQIAHLDRNPDNNVADNLTFLCLFHHDQYDSTTSQSKSIRPSEVRAYREKLYRYFAPWSNLNHEATSEENLHSELRNKVLLEISLIPHEWKNQYMDLYPGHFREGTYERKREYLDVWEMMIDVGTHEYSPDEWEKYRSLFVEGIDHITNELERLVMMFKEEVSTSVKLAIMRTKSQLHTEAKAYSLIPSLGREEYFSEGLFSGRFKSVLQALADLSRLVDREREHAS